MPLNKQVVNIPFKGLQTKIDPKMAPIGTYETVDNFVMSQYPQLVKRDGLQTIGETTTPSEIQTNYTYGEEVGLITTSGLYSYSPSLDSFQLKGNTSSPVITSYSVIANTYTQSNCTSALTTNNLLATIWEDSRGGIRLSIKDVISGTFLVSDYQLAALGSRPKVLSIGEKIIFSWIEESTTSLKIQQYNATLNSFYTAVTMTTNTGTSYCYDIADCIDQCLVVYAENVASPNAFVGAYYNVNTQTIGAPINGLPSPASLNFTFLLSGTRTISIAVDTATKQKFSIVAHVTTRRAYIKSFNNLFVALGAETEITSSPTTDPPVAITSCLDPDNNLYVFYSTKATESHTFQAKISGVFTTPTIVYNRAFIHQMGLSSTAIYYNNNAYVILGYDSTLQATYFGLRDDGACFARLYATIAGGNITKFNCLSRFNLASYQENTYVVALLQKTRIVASAGSYFTTTSVFSEQIYFTPTNIDHDLAGNVMNFAGGYLKQYDGANTVFEHGFHLYPEAPGLVQSHTGGSISPAGNYSYIVCWEWRDNYGQLHRSTPSNPTTITLTGTNDTITVTVKPLPLTNKQTRFQDARSPVIMAVYRTQNAGTVYYRVNQLESQYIYNDSTATTLTFVDTFADATIGANSTLYTTGGVLNNVATPSANLLAVCKNVAVIAGIDTYPNQVFYSKPIQPGIAIEFSNELSFIVDSLGGRITAIVAMDDKVLIFKKSLIYYVSGQFPDSLANGAAPLPLLVSSDCGCENPQSIVLTGLGIMFQSPKGIYLVDRQLNVSYIGQQVDRVTNPQSENPIVITSAINLPDENRVHFTDSANKRVLIYDTYFQQWYTHTYKFNPRASTVLAGNVYYSSSDAVYKTVVESGFDNLDSIQSTIKTNWISLANIEGYSRVYAILILGDNANLSHTLNVNIYYDFNPYPAESLTITPSSLSSGSWGEGATWGSDALWGSTSNSAIFDGTYQFVVRPQQQKCTSIQIEIFDTFPDGSPSKSFSFSGISLVAGIKSGYNKNLSYTRRLT